MKKLRFFFLIVLVLALFSSCIFLGTDYDVTFIYEGEVFQEGFTVGGKNVFNRFPIDVGNDEILVGWYTDKSCTKLFTDFEHIDEHIIVYGKTVTDDNPALKFSISEYGKTFNVSLKKSSTETHVTIPDTFYDSRAVVEITSPFGPYSDTYDALQTITIGKNISDMDYYSFNNCPNLTTIDVDTSNTYFKSIDGNVYSKDGKTILMYAVGKTNSNFIIPSTVTTIAKNSFSKAKNLQTITFHNNIINIEREAFSASGLTSVSIPPKVSIIHDGTFRDCVSLKTIDLGNIREIAETYTNTSPFSGCTALEEVIIPSGVTYLEDFTFADLTALKKVVIPKSVVRVGTGLFLGCPNVIVHIAHISRPLLWQYNWGEELGETQVLWNSTGA